MSFSLYTAFLEAFAVGTPIVLAGLVFVFLLQKNWFARLNMYPIDCGLTVRRKRLFGAHKTWMALVVMSLGTMFFTVAFSVISHTLQLNTSFPLHNSSWILSSILLGAAYTIGELPNSFVKRQLDIIPGENAPTPVLRQLLTVVDNIDSVLAISFTAFLLYDISPLTTFILFTGGAAMHPLIDMYMYKAKLKGRQSLRYAGLPTA